MTRKIANWADVIQGKQVLTSTMLLEVPILIQNIYSIVSRLLYYGWKSVILYLIYCLLREIIVRSSVYIKTRRRWNYLPLRIRIFLVSIAIASLVLYSSILPIPDDVFSEVIDNIMDFSGAQNWFCGLVIKISRINYGCQAKS